MRRGLALVVAGVMLATVTGPAAALPPDAERAPPSDPPAWLTGAAESAQQLAYLGEALLVSWDGDEPYVVQTEVASAGGFAAPRAVAAAVDVTRKYELAFGEPEDVMTRPCVVVEVTRRSDDLLRERLWVDRASMLPLRRETYGLDGDLARLASYLALDLRPGEVRLTDRVSAPELPAGQITALRAGGWALPDTLPGGYELVAVYAGGARPSRTDAAAVHAIYSDGLYAVSLFEQPGLPDWEALPAGGRQVVGVEHQAWEWPGALPGRVVWSGAGVTFTLIGDAPADEVSPIVADMATTPQSAWTRLGTGMRRLWEWLVP